MALNQKFIDIKLEDLMPTARKYKADGFRLAQLHPVFKDDDTITLVYTFVKESEMIDFEIHGIIKNETEVPSVTGLFLAAFVFENEAAELFGVKIVGNVLDFGGNFYDFAPGVDAPMTIISPEQLAARQKAARIKAAKEAKAKAAKKAAASNGTDTEALEAEIAAKTAGLDPEKAEKVRKAMLAKAKKAAEKSKEDSLEADIAAKTAGLDPEKAAKVRAAMLAKAKKAEEKAKQEALEAEIAEKTAGLDPEKAEKVRKAMLAKAVKAAKAAESKGE